MTYIAYQSAGHFDEGLSYLDYLWDRREVFAKFAQDFYGAPGLACPGVMSLAGQPLGGWGQYSLSPTMSAWSAHLFYLHWRYTADDAFLRERAYPWCSGVGACMLSLLKPAADGRLKLPLSSSPEIFDNSPRVARAEFQLRPDVPEDAVPLAAGDGGRLRETGRSPSNGRRQPPGWATSTRTPPDCCWSIATTPLPSSHRHLSNIIGLHPFNLITCEGTAQDVQRIQASLAQWDKLGTSAWCGYSFSWMSCLRARVGDAEAALRYLDIFCKAFVLRNGFHANGDQTQSGLSNFTYRPFTLEGNFLAAQAVQEMLLQSWSPTPGQRDTEIIRVFPATPARWHDVAFTDLRAEGGHKVSARRENNATTWLRIVAGKDGRGPHPRQFRRPRAAMEPRWRPEGRRPIRDHAAEKPSR